MKRIIAGILGLILIILCVPVTAVVHALEAEREQIVELAAEDLSFDIGKNGIQLSVLGKSKAKLNRNKNAIDYVFYEFSYESVTYYFADTLKQDNQTFLALYIVVYESGDTLLSMCYNDEISGQVAWFNNVYWSEAFRNIFANSRNSNELDEVNKKLLLATENWYMDVLREEPVEMDFEIIGEYAKERALMQIEIDMANGLAKSDSSEIQQNFQPYSVIDAAAADDAICNYLPKTMFSAAGTYYGYITVSTHNNRYKYYGYYVVTVQKSVYPDNVPIFMSEAIVWSLNINMPSSTHNDDYIYTETTALYSGIFYYNPGAQLSIYINAGVSITLPTDTVVRGDYSDLALTYVTSRITIDTYASRMEGGVYVDRDEYISQVITTYNGLKSSAKDFLEFGFSLLAFGLGLGPAGAQLWGTLLGGLDLIYQFIDTSISLNNPKISFTNGGSGIGIHQYGLGKISQFNYYGRFIRDAEFKAKGIILPPYTHSDLVLNYNGYMTQQAQVPADQGTDMVYGRPGVPLRAYVYNYLQINRVQTILGLVILNQYVYSFGKLEAYIYSR